MSQCQNAELFQFSHCDYIHYSDHKQTVECPAKEVKATGVISSTYVLLILLIFKQEEERVSLKILIPLILKLNAMSGVSLAPTIKYGISLFI